MHEILDRREEKKRIVQKIFRLIEQHPALFATKYLNNCLYIMKFGFVPTKSLKKINVIYLKNLLWLMEKKLLNFKDCRNIAVEIGN